MNKDSQINDTFGAQHNPYENDNRGGAGGSFLVGTQGLIMISHYCLGIYEPIF